MKKESKGYLKIATASLLWGTFGVVSRVVAFPSPVFVFFRALFSSLPLFFIYNLSRKNNAEKISFKKIKDWNLVFYAFLFWSSGTLFFYALNYTTIAIGTILFYLYPIFIALFSPFLLKEKLELKTIFSLFLSLVGIVFIANPFNLVWGSDYFWGIILALVSSLSCAIVIIWAKKLTTKYRSDEMTFFQYFFSIFFSLPFIFFLDFRINLERILIMFFVGLIGAVLSNLLYYDGLRVVKAQYAGVLAYLEVFSAIFLAMIFFKEIPSFLTFVGILFILAANFLIIFVKSSKRERE